MVNIWKDVVVFYKYVFFIFIDDLFFFYMRSIVVYFQGFIVCKEGGKICYEFYDLLKDEFDVYFIIGIIVFEGFYSVICGM